MTKEKLIELIADPTRFETAYSTICGYKLDDTECLSAKDYDPANHDVYKKSIRRDKTVNVAELDEEGQPTGKTRKELVRVARLAIPIQKKIVMTSAAFLGTPVMQSNPETPIEETMVAGLNQVWDENKLDWGFREIAKKRMSEREVAELWYTQKLETEDTFWGKSGVKSQFKLSRKILARSLGDHLYPVFDDYGKMIAFGHKYTTKDVDNKEVEHFDIYTDDTFYFSKRANGLWVYSNNRIDYSSEFTSFKNPIGKIPVIYYSQEEYEWQDVQALIDRLETKISNHADTNDYFDSPLLIAKGKIVAMATKGETGKVFEMENDADMKYLTWDQAPESTKMEIDNLIRFIYQYSCTPDISFENMKSLGAFSGVALKMFFQDALMKANDRREKFGECIQRRINYLKTAISVLDVKLKSAVTLSVKPVFNDILPVNEQERITILSAAVEGKLMTRDTAVRQNPLVENPEEEIDALDKEKKEADALATPAPATPPAPVMEVV
jgi:SPP1 family phage portal protein